MTFLPHILISSVVALSVVITGFFSSNIASPESFGDALRVITIPQGGTGTSTRPSYGQLLVGNSQNGYDLVATSSLGISGGSGSPGGSNTHVQFNDGGNFGGEAAFAYDKTLDKLTVTNATTTNATTTNFWITGLTSCNSIDTNTEGMLECGTDETAVPGGTDGQVQYNNSSSFGGGTAFIWDDTNNRLGIGTTSPYAKLSVVGETVSTFFTATSTTAVSSFQQLLANASTTLQNFTFANATGTAATTTSFFSTTASSTNLFATNFNTAAITITGSGRHMLLSTDANGLVLATSTPQVAALIATSTTATSTFAGGLTIETTGFVYDFSSNRIGIGNSTPGVKLDITGDVRISTELTLSDIISCVGSNALQTNGTGLISCGAVTGGGGGGSDEWTRSDQAVLLSTTTDRVAIGATTSPYAKLSVITGSTATTTFALVPETNQTANIIDIYSKTITLKSVFTADHYFGIGTSTPKSRLHIEGSWGCQATTTTASVTLTIDDCNIAVDASGGARTITLPSAASAYGREYHIKKIDSSVNAVTIDGNGSETIDDATTQVMVVQYTSVSIWSDGDEWWIK